MTIFFAPYRRGVREQWLAVQLGVAFDTACVGHGPDIFRFLFVYGASKSNDILWSDEQIYNMYMDDVPWVWLTIL